MVRIYSYLIVLVHGMLERIGTELGPTSCFSLEVFAVWFPGVAMEGGCNVGLN